nr:MAG TPA: hypothetical protein [Caudoviricetes sp.]
MEDKNHTEILIDKREDDIRYKYIGKRMKKNNRLER